MRNLSDLARSLFLLGGLAWPACSCAGEVQDREFVMEFAETARQLEPCRLDCSFWVGDVRIREVEERTDGTRVRVLDRSFGAARTGGERPFMQGTPRLYGVSGDGSIARSVRGWLPGGATEVPFGTVDGTEQRIIGTISQHDPTAFLSRVSAPLGLVPVAGLSYAELFATANWRVVPADDPDRFWVEIADVQKCPAEAGVLSEAKYLFDRTAVGWSLREAVYNGFSSKQFLRTESLDGRSYPAETLSIDGSAEVRTEVTDITFSGCEPIELIAFPDGMKVIDRTRNNLVYLWGDGKPQAEIPYDELVQGTGVSPPPAGEAIAGRPGGRSFLFWTINGILAAVIVGLFVLRRRV